MRGFSHFEDHRLSFVDVLWTTALGQRVILKTVFCPERRSASHPNEYHRKDAASIRSDMLTWALDQGDRPFFAFLNLYDAHDPYIPPADFARPFGGKAFSAFDLSIMERWFISDKKKLDGTVSSSSSTLTMTALPTLTSSSACSSTISSGSGRLAKTVVVVTADHGEHLGEHDLYGHASSLYDAEIRVPLLIFLPGGAFAGRTVSAPVSLRDLPATLADLSGMEDSPFPGRSLARYWSANSSAHRRAFTQRGGCPREERTKPGTIASVPRPHESRCHGEPCLHQLRRRERGAVRRRGGPVANT